MTNFPETKRLQEMVGEDDGLILNLAAVGVLTALATGSVSGSKLAREALVARGLNHLGQWIGTEAASAMWLGE